MTLNIARTAACAMNAQTTPVTIWTTRAGANTKAGNPAHPNNQEKMMSEWRDIVNAPKDGSPVWVRGWDWGKPDTGRHYGWAYYNEGVWTWERDGSAATHLTDYMPMAFITGRTSAE
jgi:hypothetical protein